MLETVLEFSVPKLDLSSYCHHSVHSLPRSSANPTIPSCLRVERIHFLLRIHYWSFFLHKTLVYSVDDIKSKVENKHIKHVEINVTFSSECPNFCEE